MKCIHCQRQHAHYETYCSVTGKLIDDSLIRKYTYETVDFCISCGEANGEGNLNCSNCGLETVKLNTKKINVNQLIDQGLTAIPDLKKNVNFIKSKTSVKEASVEHTNYIKKTPLILLPVAISIAIVMLISGIIINKFKKNLMLFSDLPEIGDITAFKGNFINAYLTSEFGINVNIPDFPFFTTLISMMHNINYSYNVLVIEGKSAEGFQILESNILLGFVIIPVISLIIGAVVYGWMAKKYNWHFWRGIVYSTIFYTLFLVIVSLFARYKADASGTDYFDDFIKIEVELLPSILNSVVTGIVLTAIIYGFFGYISYSGKQVLTKLESEWKYFKYAMYAIATTVVGLLLHFINAIFAIKKGTNELVSEVLSDLDLFSIPEWIYYISAVYIAAMNWFLSLFGKLNIGTRGKYNNESLEYAWFFNNSLYETEIQEMIEMTTFINPFILVIIIFALLGGVGFLLTKHQLLDLKEIGILAGIFTVIQLVMLYFVNISTEFTENSDKIVTNIGVAYISQFITTALFAFAAIIAGSFVKIKLFLGK